MSHLGETVGRLRKERGLTLRQVAEKLGSPKGYVSGIENNKVNPPSFGLIKKFSKRFGRDPKKLTRPAWMDKAPEILREDAEKYFEWCRRGSSLAPAPDGATRAATARTVAGHSEPS